jgi:hypothetical protein
MPKSWETIAEEVFEQLLSGMPRRLRAALDADGVTYTQTLRGGQAATKKRDLLLR